MRSYPSCWNKTLSQLGFKRKRRKKTKHNNYLRRRSLFEPLEARQMLSVSPGADPEQPDDTTVVVASADSTTQTSSYFIAGPEFHVVGGASQDLFTVSTSADAAGLPQAVLSLVDGVDPADGQIHTLELELRLGNWALEKYSIEAFFPTNEFVESYQTERLDMAQEKASEPLSSDRLQNYADFQLEADQVKADTARLAQQIGEYRHQHHPRSDYANHCR